MRDVKLLARARRLSIRLVAVACLLLAALLSLAVADPKDGPLKDAIDASESIMPDKVIYETHFLLGRILSLCPCTADAAQAQFAKAAVHRQ